MHTLTYFSLCAHLSVSLCVVTHLRADVVLKQSSHQFVGRLLEQSYHRLIQRISVLIQPACDVVRHLQAGQRSEPVSCGTNAVKRDVVDTHHSSIVNQLKVRLIFALLVWSRPLEVGRLPQMVVIEFGFKAVVRGLWEHTLLLHDGQNTHRLHGDI